MTDRNACGLFDFAVKILILLIVFANFSETIRAQEDILRIETNLVKIPTSVMDRNSGQYATNLKKEDFLLLENDVEQEIAFFEPVKEPFTVCVLLDRSGSMSNYREQLAEAASVFVTQLRPEDQLFAATFANDVDLLFKATYVKDLQNGIKLKRHRDDNATMVYDAVDYALKRMNKIQGRKAIVLFSDGASGETTISAKDNFRKAEESEALIYTVLFDTFLTVIPRYLNEKEYKRSVENARSYMKNLAEISGGRSYEIKNITDLKKTFEEIVGELGQTYSLGYYPTQMGSGTKDIKVKIRQRDLRPNLVVQARKKLIFEVSENKRAN